MNVINVIAVLVFVVLITFAVVLYSIYKRTVPGSFVRGLVVCVSLGFLIGAVLVLFKILTGGLL